MLITLLFHELPRKRGPINMQVYKMLQIVQFVAILTIKFTLKAIATSRRESGMVFGDASSKHALLVLLERLSLSI